MKYPDVCQNMIEKLLMFNRPETDYYDMPSIRSIARDAGRNDFRP
jgi:hypothetical protein